MPFQGARRTLWSFALLLLLTSGYSFGQGSATAGATAQVSVTPESLLIDSYIAGKDFDHEERAMQLASLTLASAKIQPAFDRLWSEELFQLSFQLPITWNRVASEKNALQALSLVDPVRAFELFGTIDNPVPMDSGAMPEDVRAFAARTVFVQYWRKEGPKSLDEIRAQAEHLGTTGQYPFSAMVPIIQDMAKSDDLKADSLYGEAVSFYGKGTQFGTTNQEFVDFVNSLWGTVPVALERQALQLLVDNLTREEKPTPNVSYVAQVKSSHGSAQFSHVQKELLYSILPRVREIDPQWANDLVRNNKDLGQPGAEGTTSSHVESATVVNSSGASPAQIAAARAKMLQEQEVDEIEQTAQSDPTRAYAMSASLTDSEAQSEALAAVAEGYASQHDARAQEFLEQAADRIRALPNNADKVRAFVFLSRAAAVAQDASLLRDALHDGLDLGQELYEEDFNVHPGKLSYQGACFDSLTALVHIGTQSDTQWTLTYLHSVQNQLLSAYLPIEAASALFEAQHPEVNGNRPAR